MATGFSEGTLQAPRSRFRVVVREALRVLPLPFAARLALPVLPFLALYEEVAVRLSTVQPFSSVAPSAVSFAWTTAALRASFVLPDLPCLAV